MQLGILIEQMRREGYEMTISPPKIVFSEDEQGNVMEPFEEVRSEKRRQRAKRRRAGNASETPSIASLRPFVIIAN